jgi:hypothetical protein
MKTYLLVYTSTALQQKMLDMIAAQPNNANIYHTISTSKNDGPPNKTFSKCRRFQIWKWFLINSFGRKAMICQTYNTITFILLDNSFELFFSNKFLRLTLFEKQNKSNAMRAELKRRIELMIPNVLQALTKFRYFIFDSLQKKTFDIYYSIIFIFILLIPIKFLLLE